LAQADIMEAEVDIIHDLIIRVRATAAHDTTTAADINFIK